LKVKISPRKNKTHQASSHPGGAGRLMKILTESTYLTGGEIEAWEKGLS
jgi:hypothetical protein